MAEALLSGTDAISKGTLEWCNYHGKSLVRYRDLKGYVLRQTFKSADEAQPFFLECLEKLRIEAGLKARETCLNSTLW